MNKALFITINAILLGLLGLYVGLFFLLKRSYASDEWFISSYTLIIKLSIDEPMYLEGEIYEGWVMTGEIGVFFMDQQFRDLLDETDTPIHNKSIFFTQSPIPAGYSNPKYLMPISHSGFILLPYKAEIKIITNIQRIGDEYTYIYTADIIGFTDERCIDFIEQLNLNSEEQSPQ